MRRTSYASGWSGAGTRTRSVNGASASRSDHAIHVPRFSRITLSSVVKTPFVLRHSTRPSGVSTSAYGSRCDRTMKSLAMARLLDETEMSEPLEDPRRAVAGGHVDVRPPGDPLDQPRFPVPDHHTAQPCLEERKVVQRIARDDDIALPSAVPPQHMARR